MAFTLPFTWMTVFLQPKTLTVWPIDVSSITIPLSFSWYSTVHLLPSNAVFDGFFALSEPGLVPGFGGAGFVLVAGVLCARNAGFLCVICSLSTLRRPLVIPSPWLIWLNTASIVGALPVAELVFPSLSLGGGGGGGGGGGPGAGGAADDPAVVEDAEGTLNVLASCPLGFQATPVVWNFITYAFISSSRDVKERLHSTCVLSVSLNSFMTRLK